MSRVTTLDARFKRCCELSTPVLSPPSSNPSIQNIFIQNIMMQATLCRTRAIASLPRTTQHRRGSLNAVVHTPHQSQTQTALTPELNYQHLCSNMGEAASRYYTQRCGWLCRQRYNARLSIPSLLPSFLSLPLVSGVFLCQYTSTPCRPVSGYAGRWSRYQGPNLGGLLAEGDIIYAFR